MQYLKQDFENFEIQRKYGEWLAESMLMKHVLENEIKNLVPPDGCLFQMIIKPLAGQGVEIRCIDAFGNAACKDPASVIIPFDAFEPYESGGKLPPLESFRNYLVVVHNAANKNG